MTRHEANPAAAADDLVTDVRSDGGVLSLRLRSHLTLEDAAPLRKRLRAVLEAYPGALAIAVDLTGVVRISSAALGVLVVFCKDFGCETGRMALAVARPEVRRLIQITGLDVVFGVADDLPAALALLNRGPGVDGEVA